MHTVAIINTSNIDCSVLLCALNEIDLLTDAFMAVDSGVIILCSEHYLARTLDQKDWLVP